MSSRIRRDEEMAAPAARAAVASQKVNTFDSSHEALGQSQYAWSSQMSAIWPENRRTRDVCRPEYA